MSWLTNLFSSSKTALSSRKAMSSTHEAFSLPTSSPGPKAHPDAFNPETLTSPTSSSSTYSYPPATAGGAYDYVPTSTRSRQSTLLPLHSSSPLPPLPSYPPLSHTWERLRRWLSKEYPELGDTLNYGILPQDLAQVEMSMGLVLPQAVRDSYLCADGQEAESAAGCSEGLFFGLTLLPLEDVLEEWRFWREVDDDPNTGANPRLRDAMRSVPTGWVRREYSCRGWIPLVADKAGNYLGVDLNPAEDGSVGQVIVFGRDFDTKVVMWRGDGPGGWGKWLSSFVDDLESSEGYELGPANDGSDGSEDSVGYESYFFDGVSGGQGDSGGESGAGGLHLTGEYKGWNVLEAWADRSVRRWQEAGLHTDESHTAWDKGKAPQKVSFDHLQMAASVSSSGAEVPIPVFSEVEEQTSALAATPLGNLTNKEPSNSRPVVPTISVTKPPAPLPLQLPTPEPLDSPTSDRRRSAQDDLEAGDDMIMREIDLNQSRVTALSLSQSSSNSRAVARSPSPPSRDLTESPETIHALPSPPLQVATNGPTSSEEVSPSDSTHPLNTSMDDDSPVLIHVDEAQIPETSIRLVGDGGISGSIDDLSQNDVVFVEEPQSVELAPVRSNDSASTVVGQHEKKKSISSSLKNFGQLTGGKRKDSVSLKGSG